MAPCRSIGCIAGPCRRAPDDEPSRACPSPRMPRSRAGPSCGQGAIRRAQTGGIWRPCGPLACGGAPVPGGAGARAYAVVRRTRRRGGVVRGDGGAGRVGPPATRRRLCVLRQIGDQLVAGLKQFCSLMML